MNQRPFSQACENNKEPILAVLREELVGVDSVLELASGTGQHACYFASALPLRCWQMTELAENLAGLEVWRADYSGSNLPPAVALDVTQQDWEVNIPAAIFTANSLHIMPWSAVKALFEYLGRCAPKHNRLCVYGPFNYAGEYTSESNARFDEWLAQRNAGSAIRDFEAVDKLAAAAGYRLGSDHPMPANNRLLVWHKPDGIRSPA